MFYDFIIGGVIGNIAALNAFDNVTSWLKLPQIDVQVIPEPVTLSLLALGGAAGAALAGRRRQRR